MYLSQIGNIPNGSLVTPTPGTMRIYFEPLHWHHHEPNGVWNHRRFDCSLNRCSVANQRKHQVSTSLASVRGIYRWPVNSPHKGPVTRKMCPFDDVIMLVATFIIRTAKGQKNSGIENEQAVWIFIGQPEKVVLNSSWRSNSWLLKRDILVCFIVFHIKSLYLFVVKLHSKAVLTHWGRVTHICVGNLAIIGSDNGLSPGRRQAIIRSNAGISLIGPLGTNFSEIWIGIQTFSLKKIRLKMSSAKRRPFCLGLNVLNTHLY